VKKPAAPQRNKGNSSSITFGDENTHNHADQSRGKQTATSLANYQQTRTAGVAPQNGGSSMSSLLSQEPGANDTYNHRGKSRGSNNSSNSDGMSGIMNPVETPRSAVRVRQAPGGNSSMVIG
jgi:hypothetical protein